MPFITLNGITIPSASDSVEEIAESVGDEPTRAAVGQVVQTTVGEMRRWRFETPLLPPAQWKPLESLIKAWGGNWDFASGRISRQGFTETVAGSHTHSSTGGKFGGKIVVAAGSHFAFQPRYRMGAQRTSGWTPSNGWTLMFWYHYGPGTFAQYILTGAVDHVRGASGNPVGVSQFINASPAIDAGFLFSVSASSPYVGVYGYDEGNDSMDVHYCDLVFLPFAVPTSWVPSLYAWHNTRSWSPMPRLILGGDIVPQPVAVRCRVLRSAQRVASGTNNCRSLSVEMMETFE